MVEEKHITVCKNINTYLKRLIERLIECKIETIESQEDLVDILGSLDSLSKTAKKFVDEAKKNLDFKGKTEIKGEVYRVKKSLVENYTFDPATVKQEMNEADFLRCINVIARNLETFLTKERIKEIRVPNGNTERFAFESL